MKELYLSNKKVVVTDYFSNIKSEEGIKILERINGTRVLDKFYTYLTKNGQTKSEEDDTLLYNFECFIRKEYFLSTYGFVENDKKVLYSKFLSSLSDFLWWERKAETEEGIIIKKVNKFIEELAIILFLYCETITELRKCGNLYIFYLVVNEVTIASYSCDNLHKMEDVILYLSEVILNEKLRLDITQFSNSWQPSEGSFDPINLAYNFYKRGRRELYVGLKSRKYWVPDMFCVLVFRENNKHGGFDLVLINPRNGKEVCLGGITEVYLRFDTFYRVIN